MLMSIRLSSSSTETFQKKAKGVSVDCCSSSQSIENLHGVFQAFVFDLYLSHEASPVYQAFVILLQCYCITAEGVVNPVMPAPTL